MTCKQSKTVSAVTPKYLSRRLGHTTRHFNVGQYRRKQKGDDLQDAAFFDHHNTVRALTCLFSVKCDRHLLWFASSKCTSEHADPVHAVACFCSAGMRLQSFSAVFATRLPYLLAPLCTPGPLGLSRTLSPKPWIIAGWHEGS